MDTQGILFGGARNMVSQMTAWQEEAKRKHDEQLAKNSEVEGQNLYLAGLNATDPKAQQQNFTGANAINVGKIIAQAAKDHGSDGYDGLEPNQAISRYMEKNPDKMDITNKAIAGEIDLNTWANAIGAYIDDTDYTEGGLYESYAPVDTSGNGKAIAGTVGLGALGVGGSLFGASELLDRGLNMYGWSFDMNEDEARSIQRDNVDKIKMNTYEAKQQEALEKLQAAEAAGDKKAIEEANRELKAAIELHDKAFESAKTQTRRTTDTAYDYELKGWSKAQIGDQAKAEGELLFEQELAPALRKSKQTINIQELIDDIDIIELAQGEKLKEDAYREALDTLKEAYSDPKYAEYSLMDSHILKSGIQGRTPPKYFKGKEIPNELKELNGILSSKIKDELHTKLSAEMGENTARMYLDYANLMKIAEAGVKDRAASKSKQGFGGFQNRVKDKLITPLSSKGGYRVRQVREFFESIPSKISSSAKTLLEEIKTNPKNVLKKGGKGVKELLKMDALMFAPDYKEIFENSKDEISLSLIKDRINGEGLFKGKTDEEMEEMVSIQSIIDKLQDKDFLQYLYNQGVNVDELEELLTNVNE